MTLPNASRISRRQSLAAAAVLTTALVGWHPGAALGQANATPPTTPGSEGFAGLVDVGGRSLYTEICGSGGPSIVLEAGALGRSDVWSRDLLEPEGTRQMVFPAVTELATVLLYDRPGTIGEVNPDLEPDGPLFHPSRSDAVPQPRTIAEIVTDLHALLKATETPGPYVLVGHSMGGLAMRLYASTYPDEVVGMVLIDATHEEVWKEFEKELTPEAWARFEALTVENPELNAVYPEAEQLHTAPLLDEPGMTQMKEARESSPLRPMPLVVLSHGLPFAAPFPGWPTARMEAIMIDLQIDLASLVPNSRHVIAHESGHNIHQDQPELVIDAILRVVDAVRNPDIWATERLAPVSSDWPP